jgi:hypothetical protein
VIILGSALLIVVVGIAGYLFFSSTSGQAWERDWIGNPIGLTAIATVGAAVGTVGAVLIAIYGTRFERRKAREEREETERRFTAEQQRAREVLEDERRRFQEAQEEGRKQFLASQKQTQDALEEGRRQFLENQYATNRPLLIPVPTEEVLPRGASPHSIDWSLQVKHIRIQNVGTGVATNIWGVLMPPDPIPTSHQYHARLGTPLPPESYSSEDNFGTYFMKGSILDCNDQIGGHTLCVPKERIGGEGRGELIRARLTLTCFDIFGRKHASIFDFTTEGKWVNVAFIHNIEHDLGEMNRANGIK